MRGTTEEYAFAGSVILSSVYKHAAVLLDPHSPQVRPRPASPGSRRSPRRGGGGPCG